MNFTQRLHKTVTLGLAFCILAAALAINGSPSGSSPGRQGELRAEVVIKTLDVAAAVDGVKGIDVSQWQGDINWSRVAQDDVKFAMIRASVGMEVDKTFLENAQEARANGVMVGAYHYAKFTDYSSMMEEAELFISQLRMVDINYPVALDIEANRGISRNKLTRLCTQFADEVHRAGYDVMIYSYYNFFRESLNINDLGDYKLWVANYKEEPAMSQAIWQYTSYGEVWGINGRVDLNVAYDHWGVGHKRVIKVNADISRSIKQTLNERYATDLDLDTLDMSLMETAFAIALQEEVNRQFGDNLAVFPYMTDVAMGQLESIDYVKGKTKGNITYVIQCKLFYKGLYHEYPTSLYDDATAQAIYEYQLEHDLYADGNLNLETLRMLLR